MKFNMMLSDKTVILEYSQSDRGIVKQSEMLFWTILLGLYWDHSASGKWVRIGEKPQRRATICTYPCPKLCWSFSAGFRFLLWNYTITTVASNLSLTVKKYQTPYHSPAILLWHSSLSTIIYSTQPPIKAAKMSHHTPLLVFAATASVSRPGDWAPPRPQHLPAGYLGR